MSKIEEWKDFRKQLEHFAYWKKKELGLCTKMNCLNDSSEGRTLCDKCSKRKKGYDGKRAK